MDKKNVKPFKSYEEQVKLLRTRGLIVDDKDFAIEILSNINYYRLINAYGLEYIDKNTDTYIEGTTFEKIFTIYEFDRQLRQLLFGYIEQAEITLRTAVAYELGKQYGPLGYLQKGNYDEKFDIIRFQQTLNREEENHKDNDSMRHYTANYVGIPIWVASEFMSFGTLSIVYQHMLKPNKQSIVNSVIKSNPPKPYYFESWVHQLVHVRNICAHYGRLYNRHFDIPKIKTLDCKLRSVLGVKRLFPVLIPLLKLLSIENANYLINDLSSLLEEYEDTNLSKLGFPDNWDEIMNQTIAGKFDF